MYDVFVSSCRLDYVSEDEDVDHSLSIHKVCKHIQTLKMRYRENNEWKTDDLDELYEKYLALILGLPGDSNTWTIQLCSSYFMSLTSDLRDKTISLGFKMPPLNNLGKKAKQIAALRQVRADAVRAFKVLGDKTKLMQNLMSQMGGRQGNNCAQFETQEQYQELPP